MMLINHEAGFPSPPPPLRDVVVGVQTTQTALVHQRPGDAQAVVHMYALVFFVCFIAPGVQTRGGSNRLVQSQVVFYQQSDDA